MNISRDRGLVPGGASSTEGVRRLAALKSGLVQTSVGAPNDFGSADMTVRRERSIEVPWRGYAVELQTRSHPQGAGR